MPYPNGDKEAALLIAPKPADVHRVTADAIGITRDQAKSLRYSVSYGAQPAKLAAMFGWPLSKAQQVFKDFWKVNGATAALKKDIAKAWEATGKRYIVGIDGRKLATRSEHSLLNTLFQSCGVIVMKKAHLTVERQSREAGYCTDPFEGRPTQMQMVAYHDESAHAVVKKDFKFKMFAFSSEEEAKQAEADCKTFKQQAEASTGKRWSDINHTDKCYYVAYSKAGEITSLALEEAGRWFELRSNISGGYQVGNSWATTH